MLFLYDHCYFNLLLTITFLLDVVEGFVNPLPVVVSKALDLSEEQVGGFQPVGSGELIGN